MSSPLDAEAVTVRSPDGNLYAEVDRHYRARLLLRPGTLRRYDESSLEHQLAQLARLAWVSYLREQRTLADRSGRIINTWDPKRRRYREALRLIEATGISGGEWIRAGTTGLEQWMFAIAPAAVSELAEDVLVAEIEDAVGAVAADYEVQVTLLKEEHFGYDLPPQIRRAIDRA